MGFQDKSIQCSECGTTFSFSAAEQEQFQARGYTNEPRRCPSCRQARKARQYGDGGSSSGGGYGNSSFGSRPQRQMFPAVCAQCGKETQVPFEPRQGRPVYCSDCYNKVRANQ